ncbi:MAG TPA: 30S ribosomal protein S6 [Myxococcaceae bacterium]|jgi:small subunit ribosomal protein S6|nr:30S ribosomal protein S6 [Myxococcaceae bacterium]
MPEATKAHLREYETIFLVKPDLTDDGVDRIKDRVRAIVSREGGKVLRFTVLGKKKTLYPVAKQSRAIYVHAHYLGGTAMVAEVERNLRNFDEVTRFLSVKVAEDVDPDSRPALEDVRMAGDVDERAPGPAGAGGPPAREATAGGVDGDEEEAADEA